MSRARHSEEPASFGDRLKQPFAERKWYSPISTAVDDHYRTGTFADLAEAVKTVAHEQGSRHERTPRLGHVRDRGEWANQDESPVKPTARELHGHTSAKGAANQQHIRGCDLVFVNNVLEGGIRRIVATLFAGRTRAATVARVVEDQDG